ncbi:DUF1751-domain-containing protein [Polychaeton citri CBS 116435]|uniref:DUF1751-domain-containing protein n=1 Tax=Polychaeton citri CBS 116435 TaxID=1314669 RepID=A0A9P4QDF4_9PEZI|nr:DUF1751-domain-containing protein [Polychaeton citri CBS 116435]
MAFRLNLPPLTRALLLVLLLLSGLNGTLRFRNYANSDSAPDLPGLAILTGAKWAVPFLVLVPTKSHWYPWTFLTSSLIENNAVSLIVSSIVVWFGGRYLERAWGSTEFAKFVLFTTMIPNLLTFIVYDTWFLITGVDREYYTPINGLLALSSGFLVALKQLVPEHTVSLFSNAVRIRIKHFPSIFILANILSGPLLGTDTAFWLALFGFYTSWIYLRFFRISEITAAVGGESGEGGQPVVMKGDASDTFTFVSFFPDMVQPWLRPACNAVWAGLVSLGVCVDFSDDAVQSSNVNAATRADVPGLMSGGGRRAEAERRRALALKALDQRLSQAAASRSTNALIVQEAQSEAASIVTQESVKEAQA